MSDTPIPPNGDDNIDDPSLAVQPVALQDEIQRLEAVRRSVRADIVRYEEAPGTALIPIRHVRRTPR